MTTQCNDISVENWRSIVRPLDLVLFSGGELVSACIKLIQARTLTDNSGGLVEPGEYSHVGVIVTSDILDHPNVIPGKFYIMESTMSGRYGQRVGNIDGMKNVCCGFLGTQVRDFDKLLPKYLKSSDTKIAIAHLNYNPIDDPATDMQLFKRMFTNIYNQYNGIPYDTNCVSLAASAFPFIRPFRNEAECLAGSHRWLFCSELCAQIYKDIGLLPATTNIKNVLPMDFVGYEEDHHGVHGLCKLPPVRLLC